MSYVILDALTCRKALHQFSRVESLRGVVVTAVAATRRASFALTSQGMLLSFGAARRLTHVSCWDRSHTHTPEDPDTQFKVQIHP